MIHTIIVPKTKKVNLSFTVPEDYVGQELEVIAFTKNEGLNQKNQKKNKFTILKVDKDNYTFNRDLANER